MPPGHKSQDSAWGLLVTYSAGSSSVVEYSADSSAARAQTCADTHARMPSANAMVENGPCWLQFVCISICVYQWSLLVAVCVLVVHARIRDCNAHRVEDRKLRHMSASAFWARVDLAVLSSRMLVHPLDFRSNKTYCYYSAGKGSHSLSLALLSEKLKLQVLEPKT